MTTKNALHDLQLNHSPCDRLGAWWTVTTDRRKATAWYQLRNGAYRAKRFCSY